MADTFRIEALESTHDRASFTSGVDALDRYIRQQATQDIRRRVATCYVALEGQGNKIAGYYTLSAAGVPLTDLPESMTKRLPRYPSVPVARVGRLAVDQAYRGRKLGSTLLWDAAMRAIRSEVAVYALVVDAKDERTEQFYQHHGFIAFGSRTNQLFLPLATIAKA